jgi:uncharacterized protein
MEDVTREPSMEDILASIKRIIAEDAPPPSAGRGRRGPAMPPPPNPETNAMADRPVETDPVLELTETVRTDPWCEAPAEQAAPLPAAEGPRRDDPVVTAPATPIVADAVAQASRQSLAALSALLVRPEAGEGTLEGLVRDMLRPMLKEWLDARLPELVEGMVSKEIARITGRDL